MGRDSAVLWLPATAREQRRTHLCRICGVHLDSREVERHTAACYQRNEAELRAQSPRELHPGVFGDDGVDVEFMEWHRTSPKGERFVNGS